MVPVDTLRYQPVASKIAAKLHDLLKAPVLLVNYDGLVIASSHQPDVGQPLHGVLPDGTPPLVRMPLSFDCDRLAGEVIVSQGDELTPASARLTRALVEEVINHITIAEWLPAQTELKNKFIYDTLHGKITDPGELLREAQILGMDLSQPRAVILVNARDYIYPSVRESWTVGETSHVRARQRARFIVSSIVGFFELPDDTICADIGDGEIAVLKASSHQTLRRWSDDDAGTSADTWVDLPALRRAATALLKRLRNDTQASISIGIGRYHPGTDGLARSYNDARIALTIGSRYYGTDRVHSVDDLGLAAFVGSADERTKADLASHLLNPLRDEPDLLETLTVFFEEACCPSLAASRLAIHRNTLGHRLGKIALLVGLDPRDFDDAVQLRVALLVQSMPGR